MPQDFHRKREVGSMNAYLLAIILGDRHYELTCFETGEILLKTIERGSGAVKRSDLVVKEDALADLPANAMLRHEQKRGFRRAFAMWRLIKKIETARNREK